MDELPSTGNWIKRTFAFGSLDLNPEAAPPNAFYGPEYSLDYPEEPLLIPFVVKALGLFIFNGKAPFYSLWRTGGYNSIIFSIICVWLK